MAGLTAAQVADAIGFTGQHNSPQQPAATAARPFESPARGHRKRTRDLETNSAPSNSQAVHSSGAAGHFSIPSGADAVLASSAAAHSTAAADTSRSGSPGASSSAGGAPGQDGKQPSSSQDSAQPDEEQKRQVSNICLVRLSVDLCAWMHGCAVLGTKRVLHTQRDFHAVCLSHGETVQDVGVILACML